MGQSNEHTRKSKNTEHIKLTEALRKRVLAAHRDGPDSDSSRNQFILKLIRLGVDEYVRTHSKYFGERGGYTEQPTGTD